MKLNDGMDEMFISDDEFKDLVTNEMGRITEIFKKEKKDRWTPTMIIAARSSPDKSKPLELIFAMIASDFNTADEKNFIMNALGEKCYEEQKAPMAAILSTEAWYVRRDAEKGLTPAQLHKKIKKEPMPSECPDRKEAILVAGLTFDGRSVTAMADINHDPDKNIILDSFGELMFGGPDYSRILQVFYGGFVTKGIESLKAKGIDINEHGNQTGNGPNFSNRRRTKGEEKQG